MDLKYLRKNQFQNSCALEFKYIGDRSFFMSMGELVGFRGGPREKNGTKGGGGYQKK